MTVKGFPTPLSRWLQGSCLFVQVLGDLCVVSYWIDTLVIKKLREILTLLCCIPFPLDLRQVKTYQVPFINSSPSHYIICHPPLVFLSPTSKTIFENLCLSIAMAEPKGAKGLLPGFNNLDSPSVLSKLINNDAMERPTRVIDESLNNFDDDDPEIFCYLLDESLKDAWDRLLRI